MTDKKHSKKELKIRLSHDQLFKKILENKIAAKHFLKQYLPEKLTSICDLDSITTLKESYIDHDLKNSASDLVFKLKTNNNTDSFIITIIEHQSNCDKFMAFRLFKYSIALLQTYINKKTTNKLPIIASIVYYNGKGKYNSPLNFFDLFDDPDLAREIMLSDNTLIDLSSMTQKEITNSGHLAALNFFMQNIYERDMIKLWKYFFEKFDPSIFIAEDNNYIYITELIKYTMANTPENKHDALVSVVKNNLSDHQNKNDIMRNIAESYLHQGIEKGEAMGIEKGKIEGEAMGIEKGKIEGEAMGIEKGEAKTIKLMLSHGMSRDDIMKVTGFTHEHLDHILSLNPDHK